MSLAIVYSRAQLGIQAPLVTVEVQLSNGLPCLSIVGLPETAVRESKDRVRGALLHSGFEFPARRITINLAPADLPKDGGRFDLPIALGILAASRQIRTQQLESYEFIGELALSGALRAVRGVLPAILQASADRRSMVCPAACSAEAALAQEQASIARHLLDISRHLNEQTPLDVPVSNPAEEIPSQYTDLACVRGQHQARRALEVAAAGGHNLLFIGPPGTGKTLLASCLPGILPALSQREALETAAITSVSQQDFDVHNWRQRPFRSPHHTASAVALVGGGARARPGEISRAHNGVLFLDELPEFQRHVLEVLREPLETGRICISRAARQTTYPARFQLVAAMNPCPCGYLGDPSSRCRCTREQVQRYRSKLSGPFLDKIDLHIEVPRVTRQTLQQETAEASDPVRQRVSQARQRQQERSGCLNAHLDQTDRQQHCQINTACQALLEQLTERFHLSLRSHYRLLGLARTIADLDHADSIQPQHLTEAAGLRVMDRQAEPA